METDTFKGLPSYTDVYRELLTLLSSNGCVEEFTIEGSTVTVKWHESGFDRALEEAKTSRSPFGLAGKQCIQLVMLLWQCRKDRVTPELLVPAMNKRMEKHPKWSLMDIFFRKEK
jgi:hypothetical protein